MKKITELDTYQEIIISSLLYPPENKKKQLEHGTLALCGEAGELANVLKKMIYHKDASITKKDIINELSDALWCVTYIADSLNIKLSELATFSIRKMLAKRSTKERKQMQDILVGIEADKITRKGRGMKECRN